MPVKHKPNRKNSCPYCHKRNFKFLGPLVMTNLAYNSNCKLVECENCELMYVNPLPNEMKLSKIYQTNYHHNSNAILNLIIWKLYIFEMDFEVNLIKQYKKTGKVLDIGAGSGEFLFRFPKEEWDRWIYEPFLLEKEVQVLKKKIGPHVNDFKQLKQYPLESFDVIVLRNVIEHTAKFLPLIDQIKRLLKKNGICFIRTPNMDSLDFKIFKKKWYVVNMNGHIVFFRRKVLSNILERKGLKVKLSKPVRGSAPLSLFRSTTTLNFLPLRLLISLISVGYSLISPLLGEGGDQRIIAQRK